MASQQCFHVWIDFETKKEKCWPFVGSSTLKDNLSTSSSVSFSKQSGYINVGSIYQSNLFKMNASSKFVWQYFDKPKSKNRGLRHIRFRFSIVYRI